MASRRSIVFVVLAVLLAGTIALSLAVGICGQSIVGRWSDRNSREILTLLTMPRLAMGALAGAALAMAGAMFQALFRNPLASPYTLGISSGASLGAAITITLIGGGLWHGVPVVSVAAFAGALICVVIVYAVAHFKRGSSIGTLLLTGITIGFICSACIVLLIFLARQHDLRDILQWMMGSLEMVGFDPVYEALAMASLAVGVAIYLHRDLDLLMMGEVVAASRGVSVRRSRWLVYFAASLMTAGIVAHCGPIGFVGLIIPHTMRFLVGPTHRYLLPACALAGAAFLPLCDTLARNAMWWLRAESRQVPVGVLTNLLGGGFFLYLLLARRSDRPLV